MLDLRADSIIYQSQVYVSALVDDLVQSKKLGKSLDSKWDKADLIIAFLEALEERDKLEDITDANYILYCLITLCNISSFPTAPTLLWEGPPTIIIGKKGNTGDDGAPGEQGATGLATDFQAALVTIPTVVDQFSISDAKGARWDYVITRSTGEQRSGSVIGTWSSDGANIEFNDTSTDDIVGTTANLEFTVQYINPNIQLVAVPTAGQWTVVGSRYFIPNNGNGTGPVSDVLALGSVYIGNTSNLAQARVVSGAITLDYLGVVTLGAGVITNTNINSSAAIAFSKMAPLSASLLTATDGSGIITTLATGTYPSLTEISYVKGVNSPIQTQINGKLTDPLTTIGDIIIRNGSNVTVRLPSGSPGQVLTVSGSVPSWQTPATGFADPLTAVGDLMHRNSGNVTSRLAVGSSGQVLTVSGGLPVWQNPSAGFADPMTSVGDMMIRNGSNVTSRIGIGTSGQVLTVSGGVPTWTNIPSNYITGSLVAGRVTLSTGTNTIGDDSDFTFNTAGNILMLTSGEFTGGATSLLLTTQSGNQTITLTPHGTGAVQLQSRTINLASSSHAADVSLQVISAASNSDLILLPKHSGAGTGQAGSGTVLAPSLGVGIGQPFKVDSGGYTYATGYDALYHQSSPSVDVVIHTKTKVIEIGDWDMDTVSSVSIPHGLPDYTKIISIYTMIRDNTNTIYAPIEIGSSSATPSYPSGYSLLTGSSDITLGRVTGAGFDNVNYNSTGFNRGRITVEYIVSGI